MTRPVAYPLNAGPAPGPDRATGSGQTMTPDERGHLGRVVPVYAFTGGRTRAAGQELPLEAVVRATGRSGNPGASLQMESR
ncbi:MAG TPA: hypothetical protein VGW74_11085, partial [Propionibacteriaceae bacterium]|nr:hypothetical protein [Propionibacteriaceae bacterium]